MKSLTISYMYIYYIRNKVLYFSNNDNVNVGKGICFIAVFSIINVVKRGALIRGVLIRGPENETKR